MKMVNDRVLGDLLSKLFVRAIREKIEPAISKAVEDIRLEAASAGVDASEEEMTNVIRYLIMCAVGEIFETRIVMVHSEDGPDPKKETDEPPAKSTDGPSREESGFSPEEVDGAPNRTNDTDEAPESVFTSVGTEPPVPSAENEGTVLEEVTDGADVLRSDEPPDDDVKTEGAPSEEPAPEPQTDAEADASPEEVATTETAEEPERPIVINEEGVALDTGKKEGSETPPAEEPPVLSENPETDSAASAPAEDDPAPLFPPTPSQEVKTEDQTFPPADPLARGPQILEGAVSPPIEIPQPENPESPAPKTDTLPAGAAPESEQSE